MRFAIAAALVALLAVCAAAKKQDKRDVEVQLGFDTLLRTSARLTPGGLAFGQVLNHDSQPVYVTKNGSPSTELLISNEPDFSSLLEVNVGKGKKKLFLSTHFESPRPATHYIAELEQKEDGKLVPKTLKHVDWSELGGLWIPCAGSRTPWQSHLAGEEYEPDARPFCEATDLASLKSKLGGGYGDIEGFVRFFSLYPSNITFNNLKAKFNPYRYGHIVETRIEKDGTPAVEKWYTIGRAAWEMALTMPDERTVYATDDGTNVGFFRFVADKPRDFSSGKLYAAKFTQTSAANGGSFTLNWIKLGEGDNEKLKKLAAVTTFADIFETAPFTAGACPAGFKSINQDDVGAECLKLKPGMATAAAFLETRRYAAYLGATVEFSKWEGITWDPSRRQLYTAMSSIRQGMEDNANSGSPNTRYDIGGPNHVRLPYNKCGCVYSLPVDRQYAATSMTAVVCGRNNPNTTDTANPCALDGIANPDNVAFIPELDTLLIAEDTENHENDVLWAHDIETGNQERILTTPYGAEVTSAYYYPDVNEHAYIMAVAQHPYESPFTAKANEPESSGIDATVGYFTWSTKDMKHAVGAEWEGIDYSKTNAEKHQIRGAQKMTILKKFGESR